MPKPPTISEIAAILGRRGGQSRSKAKVEAARRNAKLGGRPRTAKRCEWCRQPIGSGNESGICRKCQRGETQ